MNEQVLTYARLVNNGQMTIGEIPPRIRKDVISLVREFLAIAEAMYDPRTNPLHTKAS